MIKMLTFMLFTACLYLAHQTQIASTFPLGDCYSDCFDSFSCAEPWRHFRGDHCCGDWHGDFCGPTFWPTFLPTIGCGESYGHHFHGGCGGHGHHFHGGCGGYGHHCHDICEPSTSALVPNIVSSLVQSLLPAPLAKLPVPPVLRVC